MTNTIKTIISWLLKSTILQAYRHYDYKTSPPCWRTRHSHQWRNYMYIKDRNFVCICERYLAGQYLKYQDGTHWCSRAATTNLKSGYPQITPKSTRSSNEPQWFNKDDHNIVVVPTWAAKRPAHWDSLLCAYIRYQRKVIFHNIWSPR